MAKLPPVPKTFIFKWFYVDAAGPGVQNQCYFQYGGTLNQTDAESILSAASTNWGPSIGGQIANTLTLEVIEINDLDSNTGVQVGQSPAHVGTATGTSVTSGAALCIGGKTSLKFRGGHARVYIPGQVTASLQDSNTWAATHVTAMATAWQNHINSITGASTTATGTIKAVMAHRYSKNPAELGQPPTFVTPKPLPVTNPAVFPITSWVVNPQVCSQRRRNQS